MVLIPATACAKQLTLVPAAPPQLPRAFTAKDVTQAAVRVEQVGASHPSWPSSRVRATVAREMSISTRQLRYLLQQAAK